MKSEPNHRCPVCGASAHRCWRRAWRPQPCRGADLRPNASTFGVTLGPVFSCERCRHRFVDLANEPLSEITYEHVEGDLDEDARRGALLTYRRRCERLRACGVTGRVLEVGCWDATHFPEYRRCGLEPTGVEPSEWAVERALAAGHDVRRGTLEDRSLADGLPRDVDVVALFDVVEHVADPVGLVRRAAALLRPGGLLVMTTPRASSLVARGLGSRWWSVMPMHLQYFTDDSVRRLVEVAMRAEPSLGLDPKPFPVAYYAERVQHLLRLPIPLVASGTAIGRRTIAPNFRDRLWIEAWAGEER